MGRHSLADALFSRTQQSVLGLLFGQPDRSFYATELIKRLRAGSGAVQRELARLEESGLVSVSRVGTQKHYQANRGAPVFEELRGIARKILASRSSAGTRTSGDLSIPVAHSPRASYEVTPSSSVTVERATLARLCRKYGVRKLSLFGSAARKTMNSKSDVDLLVEFAPKSRASLFDFPAMQRDFSELFGHRRVDLVPPEVLKNPYRRKTILPDLQTLYEAR